VQRRTASVGTKSPKAGTSLRRAGRFEVWPSLSYLFRFEGRGSNRWHPELLPDRRKLRLTEEQKQSAKSIFRSCEMRKYNINSNFTFRRSSHSPLLHTILERLVLVVRPTLPVCVRFAGALRTQSMCREGRCRHPEPTTVEELMKVPAGRNYTDHGP
jgi:hypothetical protein